MKNRHAYVFLFFITLFCAHASIASSSFNLMPSQSSKLSSSVSVSQQRSVGNVNENVNSEVSSLNVFALSPSDIKFIGGTIEINYLSGGGNIRVVVLSVIDGPPDIVGEIFYITWMSGLPPDIQPGYYIELGIEVGDSVEVLADYDGADVRLTEDYHYIEKSSAGCSVDIEFDGGESCFEPGDSIKIRLEFRSDGILTDPSDFDVTLHNPSGDSDITGLFTRKSDGVYEALGTAGTPGIRIVEVSAIIEGCNAEKEESFEVKETCDAVDSELVCGYLPTNQSFSFITIEGCDGTDYYVVWETHPDLYSKLSNHLGKYVRLTGVTFNGTTPPESYTIEGWESLQVIVNCSDCVADCAIAIEFDSGETYFEPGDPITIRLYFMYDGVLTDPTHYQAILQKPGTDSDITSQFTRIAKGVYESTGTAGDPGTRTLSVTATIEGCSTSAHEGLEVIPEFTIAMLIPVLGGISLIAVVVKKRLPLR